MKQSKARQCWNGREVGWGGGGNRLVKIMWALQNCWILYLLQIYQSTNFQCWNSSFDDLSPYQWCIFIIFSAILQRIATANFPCSYTLTRTFFMQSSTLNCNFIMQRCTMNRAFLIKHPLALKSQKYHFWHSFKKMYFFNDW